MERPGMEPNTYNLDDVHMASTVMGRPILEIDPRVNCSFRAIPLRHLGIKFRELSEYGVVIHESPIKLVIMIYHRRPELLLPVVRHAWVSKYMETGAPCTMHFGPLIPCESVVVTMERDRTGNGNKKQAGSETKSQEPPQPQPQSYTYSNSTTSSEATTSPVNITPTRPNLPSMSDVHRMADFDFLGELQAQFTQHAARFPEAYRQAAQTYSGPRPYQPQPGALPLVYQSLPNGQSVRAPLPYRRSPSHPGYGGCQGNRHN
ncbi:hypothetical protein F5Y00DRAFT_86095 [Daldinia vernicosa]|uniref:uncharacterized protein n=1 Tax=Daldinia vernicosa TaxID=114800 RepID=UPI002007DCD3|nr:uncharacterized protein F5Y00DRAFT_86095 [Daldinia vernicosa]KAI0848447.1 hypothetical protein F5Y00DRAFT_86095 [Daldinia vernicosa]